MEELVLKLDRLFTSYRTTSTTQRLTQKIDQLNEFLEGKLIEERIYREDLLEQTNNLSTQIRHFDALLCLTNEPQSSQETNSLIEMKQELQIKYQHKQQLVVQLQQEIDKIFADLQSTSKEFHSAEEHSHFIKAIPANPTSVQDLAFLTQQLRELHFEREHYQQMKSECLAAISQSHKIMGVGNESCDLEDRSLQELKQISQELGEREQLLRREIDFLREQIRKDLEIIDQFKCDLLDCLLERKSIDLSSDFQSSLTKQIETLSETVGRLEKIKRLQFEKAFEAEYASLQEIWNLLHIPAQEREAFFLQTDRYSLEGIQTIRGEIARLTPIYQLAQQIEASIVKREEFIQQMKAFEISASDPARLFRSSFQLNQEERFRKTAYPTLLRIEDELRTFLLQYHQLTCNNYKTNYLEQLEQEIEERSVSETFFLFDDSGQSGRRGKMGGNENVKHNSQLEVGKEGLFRDRRHSMNRKN